MKILHVIPTIDPEAGGPSQAVLEMAALTARCNNEVKICYTFRPHENNGVKLPAIKGVTIARFPVSFPGRVSQSREMNRWLDKKVISFDVVHIHSVFSACSLMAGRICARHKVPYIVRPHGSLDPYDLRKKRILKKILGPILIKSHLQSSAAIHCTSKREADLLETYGANPKIVVLPLPIRNVFSDLAQVNLPSFRATFGFEAEDPVILFLSRLHPKKNLEIVLEAMERVNSRFPKARLAIAGKGESSYEKRLVQRAASLTSRGIVTFCGLLQGDLKKSAFVESDVFVLPSQNENFGVAVVEAIQAGLPVVVSKDVYISEEISNFGAGLLCEKNPSDLAAKLIEVIDGKARGSQAQSQFVKGARDLCLAHFDEEKIAKRLLEVYEECTKRV